ncbi:MAG: ArsA family ATPase [Deltaproteobacteria bacterium]|nr:ArsA family ATPase [Deltaproteobacteria bacterium]
MKLGALVKSKTVVVCCGAGGVGKTTTSAALALAAAKEGRRALVLTIDPARRLAQALGIPPTGKEPVHIDAGLLAKAGIELPPGGELHAWMLDPKVVLEGVVDRFAPTAEDAAKIRGTRLYQALCEVVTGLQEYTAAEALFEFKERGQYDLIILDTPPSRNALDFLDAPRRLARFLDERTLAVFAPDPDKKPNPVVRAAAKVVQTALTRTFGEGFAEELSTFLGSFGKLFNKMRIHASGVRKLLLSDQAAFVVIASPEEAALTEAVFFKGRIKDLGLVAEGFVLNRSYAGRQDLEPPHDARERLAAGGETDAHLLDALEKLAPLANGEAVRIESDRKLLDELEREGLRDGGHGAMALPFLDEVVDDLPALNVLSEAILTVK